MSGKALSGDDAGASSPVPGWYGKVVMLGDFAHRRLPHPFITTCDAWLSRGISASRAQLGSAWLDTYLTGPVWCFAWAPGLVDGCWWFGVMMPSVDAVGRYFPLVVCGSDQNPPMSAEACDRLSAWYARTRQAALGSLQPGASLDRFERELAAVPPRLATPAAAHSSRTVPGGHRAPQLSTWGEWTDAVADPDTHPALHGHSFWLADGQDGGPAAGTRLMMVSGLPAAHQFSLMLEGRW